MAHPDKKKWLEAHIRFVQGEYDAWKEISTQFLPWLSRRLLHRYPGLDEHFIAESAEDALLDYWKKPQRFDATRGVPLGYWLFLLARSHLSHLRRREQGHRAHEEAIGVDGDDFGKIVKIVSRKEKRAGYLLIEDEEMLLTAKFSQQEQVGLQLLSEKRAQEEWVQLLGIEGLPAEQQQQRIRREKDRIRKKKLRIRKRHLG